MYHRTEDPRIGSSIRAGHHEFPWCDHMDDNVASFQADRAVLAKQALETADPSKRSISGPPGQFARHRIGR